MDNTVELIGFYGSDEIIACSAWTSTSRDLNEDKKNRIPKLINMLAKEGHHTPFEKGILHFLVDTEIASHIHILKHRISSLNAESARYKELKEDKYYLPDDWPKSYSTNDEYEAIANTGIGHTENLSDALDTYTKLGNKLYHEALNQLELSLGRKRAKESARFFKTYNSQIQGDIMFNLRSFFNFQRLRNSEHAQKEIRDIAIKMLNLVKEIEGNPFKHTIKAFGY